MNYRHLFHAGNFADVFKHSILVTLIQFLQKKSKPILFLDTHAGIGKYDLNSIPAKKTQEYVNGIGRIYQLSSCPPELKTYLALVQSCNDPKLQQNFPHFYPGSPVIFFQLMREQDAMVLTELHPAEVKTLRQEFRDIKRVSVHHADGYQSIKAFLPPKKGRALILIDPAFEVKDEFAHIINALKIAYKHYPIGVYAIWYPLKDLALVKNFRQAVKAIGFSNMLNPEITIASKSDKLGLTGCGMTIINPPWQFAQELNTLGLWLNSVLSLPKE